MGNLSLVAGTSLDALFFTGTTAPISAEVLSALPEPSAFPSPLPRELSAPSFRLLLLQIRAALLAWEKWG